MTSLANAPISGVALPRRALALLALTIAGCGRSCGCVEGERSYESIHGAVRVELVRDVRWVGGRIPGPMTSFRVRIHATPRIDEPVACDHVDMAQNPTGTLVAFRCRGAAAPWDVVRRQPDGIWFRECDARVGTGDPPDFARLEPLSASATRIATCPGAQPPSRVWPALLRAIAAQEGEARAIATTVDLARAEWPPTARHVSFPQDPWPGALEGLTQPQRRAALGATCDALTRDPPSAPLWARAAPRCALDTPGVADAALRALGQWLRARPERDVGMSAEALRWAAAIASTHRPSAAGSVACAAARDTPPNLYGIADSGRVLGAVLAITRTRCPDFDRWIASPLCGSAVECDGGLCTAAELGERLGSWRRAVEAAPGTPPRAIVATFEPAHVALAVMYAQGELPREVALRNARYRYALPEERLPSCSGRMDDGTPCTCDYLQGHLCGVPSSEVRAVVGACAFSFDDARRQIVDVRSSCQPIGGSCAAGRVCCRGGECASGPDARCVSVRDAGGEADARR